MVKKYVQFVRKHETFLHSGHTMWASHQGWVSRSVASHLHQHVVCPDLGHSSRYVWVFHVSRSHAPRRLQKSLHCQPWTDLQGAIPGPLLLSQPTSHTGLLAKGGAPFPRAPSQFHFFTHQWEYLQLSSCSTSSFIVRKISRFMSSSGHWINHNFLLYIKFSMSHQFSSK